MTLRRSTGLLALLAVLALGGAGGLYWARSDQAPLLDVLTISGERLALANWRGSPVLVNFWASNCRACIEEMPALAELQRRFAPAGLKVMGIAMSYDMPSQVKGLVDRLGIPYPVVLDLKGEHAKAFGGVELVPYSVLIGRDGSILLRKLGLLDMQDLEARIQALLTEV